MRNTGDLKLVSNYRGIHCFLLLCGITCADFEADLLRWKNPTTSIFGIIAPTQPWDLSLVSH